MGIQLLISQLAVLEWSLGNSVLTSTACLGTGDSLNNPFPYILYKENAN
jgi:hypothetical protein